MLNSIRCVLPSPLIALVSTLGVIGLTGDGSAAQASSTIVIPDDPEPPYRIDMQLGPVFEGGSLTEDDWLSAFFGMERLRDGGFLFWDALTRSRILAVSPDRAARRWIGREGEGPGEYRFVRWVRARGDRVHVFDILNNRRTVLDAKSFRVLHTNRLELSLAGGYDAVVLDDTSYVISAAIHSPERIGYALHRFGADGAAANSFDEEPVGLPGEEEPLWRWLAPSSRAGHFWAGPLDEYKVDLWDAVEGRRIRSLVREAESFPPGGASSIWGVAEDSERRLWVVMTVPAQFPRLTDCSERRPGSAAGESRLKDHEACPPLWRSRIEVLDPWTGSILGVWDAPLLEAPIGWRVALDGTVYSVKSDEFGFPVVQLWSSTLRPQRGATRNSNRR